MRYSSRGFRTFLGTLILSFLVTAAVPLAAAAPLHGTEAEASSTVTARLWELWGEVLALFDAGGPAVDPSGVSAVSGTSEGGPAIDPYGVAAPGGEADGGPAIDPDG